MEPAAHPPDEPFLTCFLGAMQEKVSRSLRYSCVRQGYLAKFFGDPVFSTHSILYADVTLGANSVVLEPENGKRMEQHTYTRGEVLKGGVAALLGASLALPVATRGADALTR